MSGRSLTLLTGTQPTSQDLLRESGSSRLCWTEPQPGSEHHDRAVRNGVTAVREAGCSSLFAPRRAGAHEADPRIAVEATAKLGRADGSTARQHSPPPPISPPSPANELGTTSGARTRTPRSAAR
jgi:hypothetical protein